LQWFHDLVQRRDQFSVLDETWASFIRVTTNRRIYAVPTPLSDAFEFVRAVRMQPGHVHARPDHRRIDVFERQCLESDAVGDLVPDAFLAAAAVVLGASVASFDRDFARFDNLRWERPRPQ
jgi:toxin-antitoxin system PIN domain toxin